MKRKPIGVDRRGVYFAFQGLFMAALMALFIYHERDTQSWLFRFALLLTPLTASLVLIRIAPSEIFGRGWFQACLFLGDAAIASLTLIWTEPRSELYFLYFLIIFGTALTRRLSQAFVVAAVTSLLYLLSAWRPSYGFPDDAAFWLRFNFLWVMTPLLAILSEDSQRAYSEQERRYQERIVRFEQLAMLGQVAGEVAHRIKGPLTTIMVNAEVIAHGGKRDPKTLRELQQIQDEVGHCKKILKNLLDLGRIEEVDVRPIDLRHPIQAAVRSVQSQAGKLNIHVDAKGLESRMPVVADHSLLHEAFAAVLQNAVEACRRGGRVVLTARRRRRQAWSWGSSRDAYAVAVEDDGRGIATKDLERIFEPFFTTKAPYGSGLGLSAALRILQKHGGTIEAHSEGPGQGSRLTITIPAG